MSLLTVNNLSVGYDSHPVLTDINFTVEQGDYLFIIGENGSGKTTLMKTLLGLKAPIDGKILMGDGLKDNEKGYLPQQTEVQKDFPASAYEIVLSGCQEDAVSGRFIHGKKKHSPERIWSGWVSAILLKNAIGNCPGVSSRGYFSPELSVLRKRCSFLTSLYRDLTRKPQRRCMSL